MYFWHPPVFCSVLFQPKTSVSDKTVEERGLVKTDVKWKEIVSEHASYCDLTRELSQFDGEVLGYVTPVSVDGEVLGYVTPVSGKLKST